MYVAVVCSVLAQHVADDNADRCVCLFVYCICVCVVCIDVICC